MLTIIPDPTVRFKINHKGAIPQRAKNAHFFHMNKNIVNTTLANPIIPYMYYIQDGTFGNMAILDEFHGKYVNVAPVLVINIIVNQIVNRAPRFLLSISGGIDPSNVSGILFFLMIINLEKSTSFFIYTTIN